MASETVRIKPETHSKLRSLSNVSGRSMPELLEQAIETLRRQMFLDSADSAYSALQQDPKQWKAELQERAIWDATLADGQD